MEAAEHWLFICLFFSKYLPHLSLLLHFSKDSHKAMPGIWRSQTVFPQSWVYHENNDIIKVASAAIYLSLKSRSFRIHVLEDLVIVTKAENGIFFCHNSEDCRFKEKQFHKTWGEKCRKFAVLSIKTKPKLLYRVEKAQNGKNTSSQRVASQMR